MSTPTREISSTLVDPVEITGDNSSSAVFGITAGEFVSISHLIFQFKTQFGFDVLVEPVDGGVITTAGREWRVYANYGDTQYARIVGPVDSFASPYIEIPDAGSGSGRIRVYGGVGIPSQTTICTASADASHRPRIGDLYLRGRAAGSTQIAYICTTAGTAGTPQGVWTQVI